MKTVNFEKAQLLAMDMLSIISSILASPAEHIYHLSENIFAQLGNLVTCDQVGHNLTQETEQNVTQKSRLCENVNGEVRAASLGRVEVALDRQADATTV